MHGLLCPGAPRRLLGSVITSGFLLTLPAAAFAAPRTLRPASNRGFDDPKGLGAPPTDRKIEKILQRFSDRQTRLVALPQRRAGVARASSEGRFRDRRYRARNVIDHNPRTSWAEDEPGAGAGAWLEVEVETAPGQRLFGVVLGGGFAKSPGVFRNNPRPKTLNLAVECTDGRHTEVLLDLADTRRPQLFVFGPNERVEVTSPCRLRLTVQSVFPGRRFEGLGISEFRLIVAESR